ncbi:MAG: hypothetical protein WDN23_00960 [Edaphobacter sp.]
MIAGSAAVFRGNLVSPSFVEAMTSFEKTRLTSMRIITQIGFMSAAGLVFSAVLLAQSRPVPQANPSASALPPTPSTAPPITPDPPLRPSQTPPTRARISYSNGILTVAANNSSLNQILRQIASDTGMKITGGVEDERVFGNYGPAEAAEVLTGLLDGTSSNMILVQRDDASLAELVLTPRNGGPTPPSPHAAVVEDAPEAPRNFSVQPNPPSDPTPPPQNLPVTPPVDPATTAPPAPASTTQPDSPNGVKTPQQIYEQLQRLRQQQPPQTPPQ